jgi:tetratricopeptide (TPR) repeat protein
MAMTIGRTRWLVAMLVPLAGFTGQPEPPPAPAEPSDEQFQQLRAELEQARQDKAAARLDTKIATQRADAYKRMFESAIKKLFDEQKKQNTPSARELLDEVAARFKKPQRRMEDTVLLTLQHNLAYLYYRIGAYDEAVAFGRLAVQGRETHLGEDHRDTLRSMANLATALEAQGLLDEAIVVQRRVVERSDRSLGPQHSNSMSGLTFLCEYLFHGRRYVEAEPALASLCERQLAKGGRERQSAAFYMAWRAKALRVLGRYAEAEELLRELVELDLQEYGPDHRRTFEAKCHLAWILRLRGRTEEADRLDLEITDLAAFMEEINQPYRCTTYGGYLTFLRQYERAEACLTGALESQRRFGTKGADINQYIQPLIDLYEAWGKPREASRYRDMIVRPQPPPTPGRAE